MRFTPHLHIFLSSIHSLVTRSPEPAGGAGPSVPVGAALPTRRAQLPAASETFLLLETPSPGALTSKHPRPASLDGRSEGRANYAFISNFSLTNETVLLSTFNETFKTCCAPALCCGGPGRKALPWLCLWCWLLLSPPGAVSWGREVA